ncbi:MAG: deoxyribodipyrimidine photo-lyase [Gammaproteobacteria bacterium]
MATTLIWFRQDLRLCDHRPLTRALELGHDVVCCYVYDQTTPGRNRIGGASRWWLHHALSDIQSQLEKLGGRLVLRQGDYEKVIPALAEECGADAVYFSRNYEPFMQNVEQAIKKTLDERDVTVRRFAGNILFDPDQLRTKGGTPFKVFTPFWRNCRSLPPPVEPLPAPDSIAFATRQPDSEALEDWKLLPTKPDWTTQFVKEWQPNEEAAHEALQQFLESSVGRYRDARNLPAKKGTSRLSPYLHYGQVSPAQVYHATTAHLAEQVKDTDGGDTFLSEIGWREFSYHLLNQFPELPHSEFRANFKKFPWKKNAKALKAWQQGQTGFPIVDAGMRELWATGWMHNRVRMIVGSFLVKDLLIPWQQGAAWFWDTLVDADLASNSASWQWVSGCGADAAPYFRIFNPILQGQKFDTEGDYVRRWVPELADVPKKWIHNPSEAPTDVLRAAGVVLGKDYPKPMIDRKAARQRALDAFAQIK